MDTLAELPVFLQAEAEEKWGQFEQALAAAGLPAVERPLDALRTMACSDFIAAAAARTPEVLHHLIASGDIARSYRSDEFGLRLTARLSAATTGGSLDRGLRHFRRREMVRIAWRDIAGWAELEETVSDLSSMADAVITHAYRHLYRQHCERFGTPTASDGSPQELVILGLGKLGARELNFSSDVDLLFAYPHTGVTRGAPAGIDNEEFFNHLCRRLVAVLGQSTSDGPLFRVDLRLRPFGDSGPLVMSFDAMEHYYQHQGRDWERYAWIKTRVVAGDKTAGCELLQRLHPFVYRRYLDYGAYEALRGMKQMITREVAGKGLQTDIKIGPGGIREIEFFGQIFQLIRGGVVPELRERRIRRVLAHLAREGYIPQRTRRELDGAYVFLRQTEHRLQEFNDQQTHRLPADTAGMTRLAVAMGFADADAFKAALSGHRGNVHRHFQMLLEPVEAEADDRSAEVRLAAVWQSPAEVVRAREILADAGYRAPDEVIGLLAHLRQDAATRALSAAGRRRLDRLMPVLLEEIGKSTRPDTTLRRIVDLIQTIERRSSYLALLLEHPAVRDQLIRLSEASPWLASFMASHPVLLDELLYAQNLSGPPQPEVLASELEKRLAQVDPSDLEGQIEALCIFKQVNLLRVAAADVGGTLPLMRVSDHLSAIAEALIQKVVDLAWSHLSAKHGQPTARLEGVACDRGFAVIAYGKLGGLELGYGSDLDLVFLHAGTRGATAGERHPVDNAQFYNRLGQRVIHLLTAHTRAGRVYEIDMRLRPSGSAGVLVSHIKGYRDYQLEKAWTFEQQALIKARPVCGEEVLVNAFQRIRRKVLRLPRPPAALRKDVLEMRARMRRELLNADQSRFDLKQGVGGMVDIEFLVQYLVLLQSRRHVGLTAWTDNVRLLQTLSETGIIHENTAHVLKHAYLIYRAAAHQLSLQEQPAIVSPATFARLKERVTEIWRSVFGAYELEQS